MDASTKKLIYAIVTAVLTAVGTYISGQLGYDRGGVDDRREFRSEVTSGDGCHVAEEMVKICKSHP